MRTDDEFACFYPLSRKKIKKQQNVAFEYYVVHVQINNNTNTKQWQNKNDSNNKKNGSKFQVQRITKPTNEEKTKECYAHTFKHRILTESISRDAIDVTYIHGKKLC